MSERGILFSAPMVNAILDGRKTQTRRVLKSEHVEEAAVWADCRDGRWESGIASGAPGSFGHGEFVRCPFGIAGDQLWVRETWSHDAPDLETCRAAYEDACAGADYGPYYRATEVAPDTLRWHPSIFMPRWASRITLEIAEIRVQRLQAIEADDVVAEGLGPDDIRCDGECGATPCALAVPAFKRLWDTINGKRAPWSSNPWVWAITFRRVQP